MTQRKKALTYFKALEVATIDNEIDLSNILIEKIFQLITFKDETEKENYLNYLQGFKSFYDFKVKTLYLINRKGEKENDKKTS